MNLVEKGNQKQKWPKNFEFPEILFPLDRRREEDLISLLRIVPHPWNKGKTNPKRWRLWQDTYADKDLVSDGCPFGKSSSKGGTWPSLGLRLLYQTFSSITNLIKFTTLKSFILKQRKLRWWKNKKSAKNIKEKENIRS